MLKKFKIFIINILLIITICTNLYAANNIHISASFEPKTLALGQRGLLNIVINDNQKTAPPPLPKIDGLIIEYLGVSQMLHISNEQPSMTLTHSFTVTPQKPGNFSLPPFNIEIEGKKYPVTSSELTVTEKNHDYSNEAPLITLEVSIDNNQAYVGQMIPILIALYAPINVPGQFIYSPTIQGNNFIDYGFKENPKPTILNINNIPKQTLHFKTFITPLENGNFPLQYKVGLAIQKSRPRNSSRGFFHSNLSSFLDNMMPTVEEIEVESPPLNLSVLPLPSHGKPKDFTGAIGQFTLESFSIIPLEAQVGDPLTLKMEVKGTGNLDRISPPILNAGENWKTYPPKSTINTTDDFGYTGTKVFEYIIIPQSDKITQSPNITFSFFDQQSGRYFELTPNPVPLQITPATQSSSNFSFPYSMNQKDTPQSSPSEPELLPIKLQISHSVKSLIPLIAQQWFVVTLLAPALCIGSLLILYKKNRLKQKDDSAHLKAINIQKTIRSNLQKVEKAYLKQNALSFYDAATTVILEIVAREHPKSSQAITLHDVLELLSEKSFSPDKISFIKTLFHTSDMIKFSGLITNHTLTSEILKKFHDVIHELEK